MNVEGFLQFVINLNVFTTEQPASIIRTHLQVSVVKLNVDGSFASKQFV